MGKGRGSFQLGAGREPLTGGRAFQLGGGEMSSGLMAQGGPREQMGDKRWLGLSRLQDYGSTT